jgi:hypothetical protein
MLTEEVFAWIKTLSTRAANYYCGTLDNKKDESFGVYQLKERRARDIAIGGQATTKTGVKAISVLVHWTKSTRDTEAVAGRLYADLVNASAPIIGGKKVNYINLLHDEPIDVGTDENGICERVIEFVIYYERS